MKKMIIASAILISMIIVNGQENNDNKAYEIIEDYIAVIGGREKLDNIFDETTILKSVPGMPNITLKIVKAEPNKYYQLLTMDTMTQEVIFNGEKGKTIQFGQEMFFDEAENYRMKEQSEIDLFLNLKNNMYPLKYLGEEAINEINTYKIKLFLSEGVEWTLYFDKETYYLVRQIIPIFTEGGKFNQIVDYYDYKDYEGYIYASRIRQLMGPQTVELVVESVKINTLVDNSIFEVD